MENTRVHESAWYLKQLVLSPQTDLPSPHRSVVIDYGFKNCKSPADRMMLRAAYRKALE
jgi:hypothetical protein